MGYLSVISVHYDMRTAIAGSKGFGAALDRATGSRMKNIIVARKVAGRVLRTARANELSGPSAAPPANSRARECNPEATEHLQNGATHQRTTSTSDALGHAEYHAST